MGAVLPLAVRSIRARPFRSLLTGSAVALGVTVLVGVQLALSNLDDQAHEATAFRAGLSSLDVRSTAGTGISSDQVSALRRIPHVVDVEPLVTKRVTAKTTPSTVNGFTVSLFGVHAGAVALRPVVITAGQLPATGNHTDVAIDTSLATALARDPTRPLQVGDTLALVTSSGTESFRISGLTSGTSGGAAFTHSAVFVDESELDSAFASGLRSPLVALRIESGSDHNAVISAVHTHLGPSLVLSDPTSAANPTPLRDLGPLLVLLTFLSVMMGAGATATSIAMSVNERRREIGLLRAAGASGQQVFRLFLLEGALISFVGSAIGCAVGIAAARFATAFYAAPDLPAPHSTLSFTTVVLPTLVGYAAAVLGTTIPSLHATRLSALATLRRRADVRERVLIRNLIFTPLLAAAAVLCWWIGSSIALTVSVALSFAAVATALPLLGPLVLSMIELAARPFSRERSISIARLIRHRNRTALTLLSLVVSVATAVSVGCLTASTFSASDTWIRALFIGDVVVKSPVTEPHFIADDITRRAGSTVHFVSPLRIFSATVDGQPFGITSIDPSANERYGGLDIAANRSDALHALESGPAVVMPTSIAAVTGWHVGTALHIVTESGVTTFHISGVAAHTFPGGDGRESLVVSRTTAENYFGSLASGFDDLQIASNGDISALRSLVRQYGLDLSTVTEIQASARTALQHSVGLLLALAVLILAVSMITMITTLLSNIRYETQDVGLLRAIGMGRVSAFRLLLSEALLLTITGLAIGIAIGYSLTLPILRATTSSSFTPPPVFPATPVALLALAVTCGGVLSVALPAFITLRRKIPTALRYE